MANYVRRLTGDGKNSPVALSGNNWPQDLNRNSLHQTQETRLGDSQYSVDRFDPYRARLAQIAHPILRQLRASKWSPKDRENTNRGLLEQMLYIAESQLEH